MCVCTFIDTYLLLSEKITVTFAVYLLRCKEKTFFFKSFSFHNNLIGLERKFNCCTLIDDTQIFSIFIL